MIALVVGLLPVTAHADELRSTLEQPLLEVSHSVQITVADGVATYRVRRQFANRGKVADQAGLAIDVPSGGVATGLRIRARDRWYDGELMEREKAAALYRELTGHGAFAAKDPALLQWLWADKLYLQVFPILPGGVSTVEYTLTVPTRYANGRYWISYPRTDPAQSAPGAVNAGGARPLATPTISITAAWGDALTMISVDGQRVSRETPIVLTVPVHQPWLDEVKADEAASYVASEIVVPESSHTKRPITTATVDLGITHTYQGDLRVELLTPGGKRVMIHDQVGGTTNDLRGPRVVSLPAGTTGAGTWRLVVSDHVRLDAGSIDSWKLSFGSGAEATSIAATDTPVFIPDAPETAGDAGVATIAIAPPPITTWLGRLGKAVASPANAFARLEVDVAPQISKLPVRAQVVFLVDASLSVGADALAAQLATVRAYLSHVGDAEVEIVAYRRFATRTFGAFVPARDLGTRLDTAITAKTFALGNGSALDAGIKLATGILAKRSGPRRIVVLTDELLRTSLTPAATFAAFAALSADTVVHVVIPHDDHDDRAQLERDDVHVLAPLATRHHGILAHLRGFPLKAEKDLAPLVLELVRPTRIERLTVAGSGAAFTLDSTTLNEGDGLRLWVKGAAVPASVTLAGFTWSDPVRRVIGVEAAFSRATAGFVFGSDQHDGLDPAEMMKLALAGRAVTPVTSYVAFEPGTRPSTIGLEHEGFGMGRSGFGAGGGGLGMGMGISRTQPNLAALVDTRECQHVHKPAAGWRVQLAVETTKTEIVDVALKSAPSPFASCLVEAVWTARLDAQFDETREQFAVELR